MSIQPDVPLLDSLRAALQKADADTRPETPTFAELKQILRERIAELESLAQLLVNH